MVCTGDSANCQHLHQNGAKNTIVRLPESVSSNEILISLYSWFQFQCGKGPFARIASVAVSEDQSVPSSIASKLAKRDGGPTSVMTIGLDTDFSVNS